jgi:hypothetical protein
MSVDWTERQRHTNKLVRRIAGYLFDTGKIGTRQVYGLSKLAWITNSYEGDAAAYIESTKIPALSDIFDVDFSNHTINDVAKIVAAKLKDDSVRELILAHSGFTNFYKAYRNSVLAWIGEHHTKIVTLFKSAYIAESDTDRLRIVNGIAKLPGIPKANHPDQKMKPEYFLSPAFFMLDREIKFPLINGNKGVQNLLHVLKVAGSDLPSQYRAMVNLYGQGGIMDAADLDQVGLALPDFLTTDTKKATKKLLEKKNESGGRNLPLKDEADFETIKKAGSIIQRRIHNKLTNKLRDNLSAYTLLEGRSEECMFDALVQGYDGKGNDLLIEVKSSSETGNVRMAIGQLFDYWFKMKGDKKPHLAILLPERPADEIVDLLQWLHVGFLWFEGKRLHTQNNWLQCIADKS